MLGQGYKSIHKKRLQLKSFLQGPPHDKTFTVSLHLGKEKYVSKGSSLKKAQRNAASLALSDTNYALVPLKDNSDNKAALTPTVMLNNLSFKLGFAVQYFLVDEEKEVCKISLIQLLFLIVKISVI